MELHEKTYEEFLEDSLFIQKRDLIKKACDFLVGYTTYPYTDKGNISKKKLNAFIKAMEE